MRTVRSVSISLALLTGIATVSMAADEPPFGPMAPARVSGTWKYSDAVSEGQVERLPGELMFEVTGAVATYEVASDDARLSGTGTATRAWVTAYPPALVMVVDTDWRLENESGAWAGSSRRLASMADDDPLNVAEQVILDGSGAYAGLTAYLIIESAEQSFLGAIIPDEMPEIPADWVEIYQSVTGEDSAADG